MREMVLNHASLQEPNQHIAVEWLKGMAAGMLVLVRMASSRRPYG